MKRVTIGLLLALSAPVLLASGLVWILGSSAPVPLPSFPRANAAPSPRPATPPLVRRTFNRHVSRIAGLSLADLERLHDPPYLAKVRFDVRGADYHDRFVARFDIPRPAQAVLDRLGFVVLPAPARGKGPVKVAAGPADIYYRVFAADLPVFISADSVLHAWHRSFEEVLAVSEEALMWENLHEVLFLTTRKLDASRRDQRDAWLYLAVALSLLRPEWKPPAPFAERLGAIRDAVHEGVPWPVRWLGRRVMVDFSQLRPRGHYTRSVHLKRYFRAMTWLGRMELTLHDGLRRRGVARDAAAARALLAALRRSGAMPALDRLDRYYAAMAGQTNALGPRRLLRLCQKAGVPDCRRSNDTLRRAYASLGPPAYSGRFDADDRENVTLRLVPQRFDYGAWVMSRATVPELAAPTKDGRTMASPLDVAFALGADRALTHLGPELGRPGRERLPAVLEATRLTLQHVPPTRLADSVNNHWLEALIALARTQTGERVPQAMRTAAWHDRKLEAVLASWTELRHDTVLMVEQAVGGIGCQFPRGYVDPVPGLYRSLRRAARRLAALLGDGGKGLAARHRPPEPKTGGWLDGEWPRAVRGHLDKLPAFLQRFERTMARLTRIAEAELAGKVMPRSDLDFINRTVDRHAVGYGGTRLYDGWYPALYWTPGWGHELSDFMKPRDWPRKAGPPPSHIAAGISKPNTADVQTDADRARVLQLAVGHPELLVLAIEDHHGHVTLYGGPVYSFYQLELPLTQRMTDREWRLLLDGKSPPRPPPFARSYR